MGRSKYPYSLLITGKAQKMPPCFGISFGGWVGSCVGSCVISWLVCAFCFSKYDGASVGGFDISTWLPMTNQSGAEGSAVGDEEGSNVQNIPPCLGIAVGMSVGCAPLSRGS
jgi:hypothetical protein